LVSGGEQRGVITEPQWQALRQKLRDEARTWQQHAAARTDWTSLTAAGALASATHTAYHLGAIRQILAANR
jgi:hypothetical protein